MANAMLRTKQVADEFQVSVRTIQRWIGLGIFPRPVKVLGTVRFRQEDVEAFKTSGWLDPRPGRPGGMASGWLPMQEDIPAEQLGDASDVNNEDNADEKVGD